MKRVIIESPFAGRTIDILIRNTLYLEKCILDSLSRGEAPFASHGFYTNWLDDTKEEERKLGMEAGFAWGECAELIAVYYDYGVSKGMAQGIIKANSFHKKIVFRKLSSSILRKISNEKMRKLA